MKRLLFALCLVVCGVAFAAASGKGATEITFEKTAHDFGTLREADGPVSVTFKYSNTGNAPLVLTTVSAPCGCTKPKFSPKPLAPDGHGEIVVTFSPKDISGEFMRTISVWTNVPSGKGKAKKKVILKISGVIVPAK